MSWGNHIPLGIDWPKNEPPPGDVREQRKAIFKAARDSQLIRQSLDCQHYLGLNGEDMMTNLAFNALVQLESFYKRFLQTVNIKADPPWVIAPKGPQHCAECGSSRIVEEIV